jgi:hypothetical protein
MPRELLDLRCELQDVMRYVGIGGGPAPAVDLLRPSILLALGEAERLRRVPDGAPRPVRDDIRDLRRVVPPVAFVDVLDDLFSPSGFDVDVDVRRPVACR